MRKKRILKLTRSESEIRNIWSNWTDKRTEPYFYHSTKNERISISPAPHFSKFLYQPAFGTFAKPLKPTHNSIFAKEPNFSPPLYNDVLYLYCQVKTDIITMIDKYCKLLFVSLLSG